MTQSHNGKEMIVLQKQHTKQLALGALFCALTTLLTLTAVPTPLVGNVNLGDAALLLGAWILGGPVGAIAGALGAAIGDLIGGYAVYAPGTLLIKLCVACVAILLCRLLRSFRLPNGFCRALAGITAELLMILGYFLYESFILSFGAGAAVANVPFNAVQGTVAVLLACLAYPLIERIALRGRRGR